MIEKMKKINVILKADHDIFNKKIECLNKKKLEINFSATIYF